jgi:hexosaminidase
VPPGTTLADLTPKFSAKGEPIPHPALHQLQAWFIGQFDTYLAAKGRRLIGWDEILEGGLAPGAAVMSWRGEAGGIAAARAGHDVVMTPSGWTYLDAYQSKGPEPLAIGYEVLDLAKVYGYEPVPSALTPEEARHVLGSQGLIWTEYVATPEHLEYMVWPRLAALAEVLWSPRRARNFPDFRRRLKVHEARLEVLDVHFRPTERDPG